MTVTAPPFSVIPGAQVQRVLQGREKQIVDLVEATYRLHSAGDSTNPMRVGRWRPRHSQSAADAAIAAVRVALMTEASRHANG